MQVPRAPYPSVEDVPVTFQVGMVARDGVILASDTRVLHTQGARTNSTTQKIIYDKTLHLAFCWSGDHFLGNVAQHTTEVIRGQAAILNQKIDMRDLLWRALCEVWASFYAPLYGGKPAEIRHSIGSLLVAYAGVAGPELWRLNVVPQPDSPIPITTKTAVGDAINQGSFFLEQYYRPNKMVKELLPLAAHCILMGAAMNPTGVEGLEMITFSANKCERLSDEQLQKMKDFSKHLDSDIAAKFNNES